MGLLKEQARLLTHTDVDLISLVYWDNNPDSKKLKYPVRLKMT